ncbi:MAG: hypothetical protein HXM21_00655 [Haemophilus influenzae]|nr:hypothetical protein [Haemophilus influenzae]
MKQVVIINGYETVIEIPEGEVLSPVKVQGDQSNYEIEYGNGLKEVGGIVEVQATTVKEGVIEGVQRVELPFVKTLDFQVTAINVSASPAVLTGEFAFARLDENTLVVYGTANASEPKTIQVKWTAKGIA